MGRLNELIHQAPSARQIRRAVRHHPLLPGRPGAGEDPRFWGGILLGVGIGAIASALLSPRRGPELREQIRGRVAQWRDTRRGEDRRTLGSPANSIEESIEVAVPASKAYQQWTRFEEFPKFMEGVVDVRRSQHDPRKLHWKTDIAGVEPEWDAEITEQSENQRVAWRSRSGTPNAGVVTFHHLSDDRCKVMLQLEYEPDGALQTMGARLGVLRNRVRTDLERFRDYMEGQQLKR